MPRLSKKRANETVPAFLEDVTNGNYGRGKRKKSTPAPSVDTTGDDDEDYEEEVAEQEIPESNQYKDTQYGAVTEEVLQYPVNKSSEAIMTKGSKHGKKLAPRSGLQFKVGPQFSQTHQIHDVFLNRNTKVVPLLAPRIDRGFELIDNEWVGYKRNYFTLVSSFQFEHLPFESFTQGNFTIFNRETRMDLPVNHFAVRLVARCSEDGSIINLIQHTAKRDKGPQISPPIVGIVPSPLPNHSLIREASNVRNDVKLKKYDSFFWLHKDRQNDATLSGIVGNYPSNSISRVARYERIQFASSINVKKPTGFTKHFKLIIELGAMVHKRYCPHIESYPEQENCCFIPVAYTETPPLIIRGRSPSNYTPTRRYLAYDEGDCSKGDASYVPPEPKRKRKKKTESDENMIDPNFYYKEEQGQSKSCSNLPVLDDLQTYNILKQELHKRPKNFQSHQESRNDFYRESSPLTGALNTSQISLSYHNESTYQQPLVTLSSDNNYFSGTNIEADERYTSLNIGEQQPIIPQTIEHSPKRNHHMEPFKNYTHWGTMVAETSYTLGNSAYLEENVVSAPRSITYSDGSQNEGLMLTQYVNLESRQTQDGLEVDAGPSALLHDNFYQEDLSFYHQ